jgi:membrane dipeptidase
MMIIPVLLAAALVAGPQKTGDDEALRQARRLAKRLVILDTHIDVPYRLREKHDIDISKATSEGDFDYPRALAGGLDGCFMSIYTPWQLEKEGRSKALADSLIDMVEGFAVRWPNKFALTTSPAEVLAAVKQGKFAMVLGMENGSPIEGDLRNVRYFHDRGVRYITLTHAKDNHICDSSYDDAHTWKGLSTFGRTVVREMNRVGIMIDVSHISDDTFYQVMELSQAPVIASHSSCRHFTPGWERNMSDEMIRELAKHNGVIQINFGSTFVRDDLRRRYEAARDKADQWARDNGLDPDGDKAYKWLERYFKDHPIGFADVKDVADNIDHVVSLVGVDHVGLGSDFDGLGDSLPTGLKDVSQYPNLIKELLARGYDEEAIAKICSGNLLRVWREVDRVAGDLSAH